MKLTSQTISKILPSPDAVFIYKLNTEVQTRRLMYTCGAVIGITLVSFFLVVLNVHALHPIAFRSLGFLILLVGLAYAYWQVWQISGHSLTYLAGLWFGLVISMLSVFPFAIFCGLYFALVYPDQLTFLFLNALLMGKYITPFAVSLTIVLEGMGVALIATLCFMQYYKIDS